ncbi:hypothetical protein LSTR_LSTR015124 [Laodelphax striatellus]|uniref:Uncharacterized protein n=1 Tax=Laodelphax striatellus TaxID=195883 RepID=A0A482WL96_LAOST|nr:hypothetical protein LSTR_LSTR015124 [Laodelphax striatellus]
MRKLTQKKVAKDDPKQTKISKFFTSPTNSKKLTAAVSSIRCSASSSSQLTCEVDLTEDDGIKFPLTPPKSQNIFLSGESGKTVCYKSPAKKKSDKENSVEDIEEIVKERVPILSPEVIPPTPPQSLLPTSRAGNKGVKRKFEFSTSKNCDGKASSSSVVHVKKISKKVCNGKVESTTANIRPSGSSTDRDSLLTEKARPKEKLDPEDCGNEKKDIVGCRKKNVVDDESLDQNDKIETKCNI